MIDFSLCKGTKATLCSYCGRNLRGRPSPFVGVPLLTVPPLEPYMGGACELYRESLFAKPWPKHPVMNP